MKKLFLNAGKKATRTAETISKIVMYKVMYKVKTIANKSVDLAKEISRQNDSALYSKVQEERRMSESRSC